MVRTQGCIVVLLLAMAGMAWAQYPTGIGVIGYTYMPLDAEVSPSGNRLGLIEGDRLRTMALRDDGYPEHPENDTEVQIPGILHMAFTPNGQHIICPDIHGKIYIVDRDDWAITALDSIDGQLPAGVATVGDPRYAYVLYVDRGRTTILDYRDREVVGSAEQWSGFYAGPWRGRDICVSADGRHVFRLYVRGDPEEAGCLESMSYPYDVRPVRPETEWTCSMGAPAACCTGPDGEHVMTMSRYSGQLYLIRQSDGYAYPRVNLDTEEAVDVDFSADGRWVVVTSARPRKIIILWAEDLRAMVDPNREMAPEDVRRSEFDVSGRPRGCCLHPTLGVAYVYSAVRRSMRVIALHVPGAG